MIDGYDSWLTAEQDEVPCIDCGRLVPELAQREPRCLECYEARRCEARGED